jgi:hypothetical protein
MVQKGQTSIETSFHGDDQHSSGGEGEVKDNHGGEKEEKNGKQDGAKQKLVEVVIA